MDRTNPNSITKWINEIAKTPADRFHCPNFLKPFHLVTLGLAVKQRGWPNFRLPSKLEGYAARMKLWESVEMQPPYSVNENPSTGKFLPVQRFIKNERNVRYTADELVKIAIKTATDEYQNSLSICLEELINNFFDHSASKNQLPCLVSAQSWPRGNLVQIAIADAGIGIRGSLSVSRDQELLIRLKKTNACKLASEYGTSSKLGFGHAGYGLTLAKDLMKQAGGSFLLLSGDELFANSNNIETTQKIKGHWKGTLIVLELQINTQLSAKAVYESWPLPEGYSEDDFF